MWAAWGPVAALQTAPGKVFAALYALYSGLVVIVVAGLLLPPVFHRIVHHFAMAFEDEAAPGDPSPQEVSRAAARKGRPNAAP
ncbi:MAG TPA: hypothetical protein VLH79_15640 [Chthonomonadales bacterium]|nr:hypothetical protein [Chthonomonadales bacterium]